jgi:prevent-host-death family protein
MRHVSTLDARNHFAEIINRTAYGQERVVLIRRGKDLVALVPLEDMEILEKVEDLYDLREALAAIEEADPKKRVSLRDLANELDILLT